VSSETSAENAHSLPRSNLHVLTLTPFYPTAEDDANGCFVAEPLASLAKLGVQNSVFVVTPFYRALDLPHAGAPAASSTRYPAWPGGTGLASAGAFLFAVLLGRIRKLHARTPIDVIHAHGPLPAGHAAMLLGQELKVPFVVTVHGLDAYADRQVSGRAGRWSRNLSGKVFQAADRVLCVSERVRERVLAGAASAKAAVVYNGADPERFAPACGSKNVAASREKPRAAGDQSGEASDAASWPAKTNSAAKIVSIGNLIPTKGHEQLLRALAALTPTHPEIICEIVGNGPLRSKLESRVQELGIGSRVRFLGRKSRQEVADLLRSATLFVLPSSYEGLGCVYLEAMASEVVAIGCRGQGIEEIIRHGHNGWLVAPNDVEELTRGMASLLEHGSLRSYIAAQGRDTVLHEYTIQDQARRLVRTYEECAR